MSLKPPQMLAPGSTHRAPPLVSTLDAEIFEEKAATLARLTRIFEDRLAAWREAEAEAEAKAGAEAGRHSSQDKRQCLLDEAAGALWQFVVQREACGLKNTEAVLRHYEVPPALRLRMGVIRRR